MEICGKFACVQKLSLSAFGDRIVMSVWFRDRLCQQTSREENQQTRNLIERNTTSPLYERRIVLLN